METGLRQNPNLLMPQGFSIIKETEQISKYQVPACFPEGHRIALETLDTTLFEAIGVHFLEAMVTTQVSQRVRPKLAAAHIGSSALDQNKVHPLELDKKRSRSVRKLSPIKAAQISSKKLQGAQAVPRVLSPRLKEACNSLLTQREDLESQLVMQCGQVLHDIISQVTRPTISTAPSVSTEPTANSTRSAAARPPKPKPARNRALLAA